MLKLMERAPHRVVAGVLEQPIGISDENREALKDNLSLRWATELAKRRPELNEADIHKFRDRMFNPEGNFVYSVTREFVSSCTTPMLVMPGNIGNLDHPNAIGREIAALAPKSEILEDWRYPADVVPGTVAHIRRFLKAHTPG
ncbi:MAG: hypothetical protein HY534_04770 [Chloroflexi bacterium]|nr:hypothetical protein [Chloroflexota bacterium]